MASMTKDQIAKEAIQVGLNLSKEVLQVDGSAVIPSVVGLVLDLVGDCSTCKYGVEYGERYNEDTGEYGEVIQCLFKTTFSFNSPRHFCADYKKN